MEITDILTITAIILGPIVAVQLEKYLQRSREVRERKHIVFKTLMATRGSALSLAHVEALNRIDLEFSNESRYKKVIEAWKEYFDNLGQKFESNEEFKIWAAKNEELLANLLYEMGQSLGYKFDKVLIKRNMYSPVGHARIERENELIRDGLIKILQGETLLPVNIGNIVTDENTLKNQIDLQNLMIKYYNKKLGNE